MALRTFSSKPTHTTRLMNEHIFVGVRAARIHYCAETYDSVPPPLANYDDGDPSSPPPPLGGHAMYKTEYSHFSPLLCFNQRLSNAVNLPSA